MYMCIILNDLWIEIVVQTIALEVRISAEERKTFFMLACMCLWTFRRLTIIYSTGLILCTIAHIL